MLLDKLITNDTSQVISSSSSSTTFGCIVRGLSIESRRQSSVTIEIVNL